ncbi:MAG: hypothetical protein EHM58_15820 [Ignavibacteriae bacterium]|nr:MAG: hypothetical protein EHM58_15820 [Ignavibacteriota bacterium]
MDFKCSTDKYTKIQTIIYFGPYLTAIFFLTIFFAFNSDPFQWDVYVFTVSILLFIYFSRYFTKPVSYTIINNMLIIRRKVNNIKISFDEIYTVKYDTMEEYRLINWSDFINTQYYFFGGFYWGGKIFLTKLGEVRLYMTQLKNFLVIETGKHGKIIITPDDLRILDHFTCYKEYPPYMY